MGTIELDGLRKEFGDLVAVDDVSLTVNDGELLCLLGPSGCGKSTTLRMIDGLERPTDGRVMIDNNDVTDDQPYERDCSMVFQSWSLFPYKTVLENVAFGLKMKGVGKQERHERAREMLELMHMGRYEDENPHSLSGGEQQRVALARSLTMDPSVLLLDEPLSSLDQRLREEMQIELKNIHEEVEKTMVHVTHDQNEAFTLADRIGLMNQGRLVQVGTPREVYSNPQNRFVEEFIGESNFLTGQIQNMNEDECQVDLGLGKDLRVPISNRTPALDNDRKLTVSLRPEIVGVDGLEQHPSNGGNGRGERHSVEGTVTNSLYRGSTIRYYLDIGGTEVFIERPVTSSGLIEKGDKLQLTWDPAELLCFDSAGKTVWS